MRRAKHSKVILAPSVGVETPSRIRTKVPNGPADVIVTFDERRRPVSTFFESAPLGSHEELMDAAQAIKNCVAYGPKARGESDKSGATSMIGR